MPNSFHAAPYRPGSTSVMITEREVDPAGRASHTVVAHMDLPTAEALYHEMGAALTAARDNHARVSEGARVARAERVKALQTEIEQLTRMGI